MRDGSGCSFPFFIEDKIVIDTLHFTISKAPAVLCDSALVQFMPQILSVAKDELQRSLQYAWSFGTGNAADTAIDQNPSFLYTATGNYPVTLTVSSPYGCAEQVTDTVKVKPIARGTINGPSDICEGAYATFTATANGGNSLQWQWQFEGNSSSTQQEPAAQVFTHTGLNTVSLIVNNDGCYDTTYSLFKCTWQTCNKP